MSDLPINEVKPKYIYLYAAGFAWVVGFILFPMLMAHTWLMDFFLFSIGVYSFFWLGRELRTGWQRAKEVKQFAEEVNKTL